MILGIFIKWMILKKMKCKVKLQVKEDNQKISIKKEGTQKQTL
jgi:hypothetical protein